jgi:hypothetical protein
MDTNTLKTATDNFMFLPITEQFYCFIIYSYAMLTTYLHYLKVTWLMITHVEIMVENAHVEIIGALLVVLLCICTELADCLYLISRPRSACKAYRRYSGSRTALILHHLSISLELVAL